MTSRSFPGWTAVVKLGGSLSRDESLPKLCASLGDLSQRHKLLLIPGGAGFADTVRDYGRHFRLDDNSAHWMAILGMDQYGYLLSSQIPGAVVVRDVDTALSAAVQGRLPILLPFEMLLREDPLPHSWDVTSDSIAAWIAKTSGSPLLVLLKDVDGIFQADPKQDSPGSLLGTARPDQLGALGGIDPFFAKLLNINDFRVWIINGRHPERLEQFLIQGTTSGTTLSL